MEHIGEPNVLLRLLFNIMILLVCLSLLWLPYRWQEASASRRWVVTYVCFTFVIGVLFHTWTLTLWMPVHIVHNLMPALFIVCYTWYELHERVLPPLISGGQEPAEENSLCESVASHSSRFTLHASLKDDDLWPRIDKLLHEDNLWRNPDLTLDMLCRLLGSNKDYVLRCFRENVDTTFLDYVNSLRIAYVTEEL